MDFEKKKCPECGGEMVRSRNRQNGYAQYFWVKPWKKIGGLIGVWPYLCMKCGRVGLYADEKGFAEVKEDYERERYG